MENKDYAPTKREIYTGQKKRYFAVYYNFALKKLLRVINDIDRQYQALNKLKSINEDILITLPDNPALISDKCYALLKDYCWKAFTDAKNTSGMPLTGDEKKLIAKLCYYLVHIRNFHSHYYHSNEALKFKVNTVAFIETLFDKAKYSFAETNMQELNRLDGDIAEMRKGIDLFSKHEDEYFITSYGRIFFLSLFLNKAEMNRLLDDVQKDDAGKIFKHKILRNIFTTYCHRGGVERFKYNHDETLFTSLDPAIQKSILHLRQVYRIVNYLNNVPIEVNDTNNFPLFFETVKVKDKDTGKYVDKIQGRLGKGEEYVELAKKLNLFPSFEITAVNKKEEKATNAKRGVNYKQGKPYFAFGNIYNIDIIRLAKDNAVIEFKLADFHKLVLTCIKDPDVREKIVLTINTYISNKNEFVDYFNNLDFTSGKAKTNDEEKDFLKLWNSYSYFWKGIDNALRVRLNDKKQQYIKGTVVQANHKIKTIEAINERIISLRYIDLFHENQQIARKENLFTKYAVQYIIDHNLLPNWHWQHHQYHIEEEEKDGKKVYVNKKRKSYHNTTQQLNLSVDANGQAMIIYSEDAKIENPEQHQVFVLGPAALRNILLCYNEKENKLLYNNKPLNDFLKQLLEEWKDRKNPANNLVLPKFIPTHAKEISNSKAAVIKKARLKVEALLGRFQGYQQLVGEGKFNKSRNDKNALIMYLYRLYEGWQAETKNGKEVKFLRKQQYQLLSVYHYYLQKATLDGLIKDFTYMIPPQIKTILKDANSIDDLLQKLLKDVVGNLLPGLLIKLQPTISDDNLKTICQKLRIKKHLANNSETANKLRLPYDIHPLQVMMYAQGKTASELVKQSFVKHTIQSDFDKLSIGLRNDYYQIQGYADFLAQHAQALITADDEKRGCFIKSLIRNAIGTAKKIQVQDILLWRIAQKYMKVNAGYFEQHNIRIPQVTNLRKAKIMLPVKITQGEICNVELFYHQLDDLLFIETKEYLNKLTAYYSRHIEFKYKEKPGSPIEFTKLQEEHTRLVNDSLLFTGYLLNWEMQELKKLKEDKVEQMGRKDKGMPRIDFKQFCQLRGVDLDAFAGLTNAEKIEAQYSLAKQLNELNKAEGIRNKAFHADIPKDFVYAEKIEEPFIQEELVKPFEKELERKKQYKKSNAKPRTSSFNKTRS